MAERKRTYAEPWRVLKSMGAVSMKIVGAELTEATIKKYAKTYRKAIQKEKYLDEAFRWKYPNSKIESEVDYTTATIRFTLHLNNFHNVSKELFNARH